MKPFAVHECSVGDDDGDPVGATEVGCVLGEAVVGEVVGLVVGDAEGGSVSGLTLGSVVGLVVGLVDGLMEGEGEGIGTPPPRAGARSEPASSRTVKFPLGLAGATSKTRSLTRIRARTEEF
eukprot:gene9188-biopygen1263